MSEIKEVFKLADILLPSNSLSEDFSVYPVIACDQHTSEPEYWSEVSRLVGNDPSTLNMMIPEIYLDKADEKTPLIHSAMRNYEDELLTEYRNTMILCERTQADGRIRQGIVCALDLEAYDFAPESKAYVRATEGTVLSRIPARVAVRRGASLELPHVMLLINDPELSVIEPEFTHKHVLRKVYDTDLMLGGGHITGYVPSDRGGAFFMRRLNELANRCGDTFFSVAVGDGNHSLASAKARFEEIKKEYGAEAAMEHPLRYALCEVVNIYSPALDFEPIHRIIYGISRDDFENALFDFNSGYSEEKYTLKAVTNGKHFNISLPKNKSLSVAVLTDFLDTLADSRKDIEIDYIHGDGTLISLSDNGGIGIFCDKMEKSALFEAVGKDGPLPRKTFSMGHACDKRYYIEARKINI